MSCEMNWFPSTKRTIYSKYLKLSDNIKLIQPSNSKILILNHNNTVLWLQHFFFIIIFGCSYYSRLVQFEYVMLKGVNDSIAEAYQLLDILKAFDPPPFLNLIPVCSSLFLFFYCVLLFNPLLLTIHVVQSLARISVCLLWSKYHPRLRFRISKRK